MMHLQTPKRPFHPPPTPSSSTSSSTPSSFITTKYTLPPLSSILSSSSTQSNYIKDHPLIFNSSSKSNSFSTPYKQQQLLPSIDSITTTPIDSSIPSSYNYYTNQSSSSSSSSIVNSNHSTQQHTPTSINSSKHDLSLDEADTSIIELRKSSKLNLNKIDESTTTLDKAYAFISHSPATFPSQEPSIDNAPLARRKRRRTSTNELNILNKEFKLGITPNKLRRIEIAKKVSMTEKAVQIWFQNKRQSLRKHLNNEKEITLLPETPSITTTEEKPVLISSTPTKPILNKSLSFVESPQPQLINTNIPPPLPRSFSIPVFKPISSTTTITTTSNNSISEIRKSNSPNLNSTTMIQTNKKQPQSLNGENTSTMTFKLISSKITQKLHQESIKETTTTSNSSTRKPLGDITNKLPSIKK